MTKCTNQCHLALNSLQVLHCTYHRVLLFSLLFLGFFIDINGERVDRRQVRELELLAPEERVRLLLAAHLLLARARVDRAVEAELAEVGAPAGQVLRLLYGHLHAVVGASRLLLVRRHRRAQAATAETQTRSASAELAQSLVTMRP